MSAPDNIYAAFLVEGEVQMVGCRGRCSAAAHSAGITEGSAVNMPDGAVIVSATGPPKAMAKFSDLLNELNGAKVRTMTWVETPLHMHKFTTY